MLLIPCRLLLVFELVPGGWGSGPPGGGAGLIGIFVGWVYKVSSFCREAITLVLDVLGGKLGLSKGLWLGNRP